ncbi:MAG: hypothetical protein RJA07_463 [Bacteroidota bacterium]|jgi:hypothetical protein
MRNKFKKKREAKVIPMFNHRLRELHRTNFHNKLTKAAWDFAYAVLWTNETFSEEEKMMCMDSIKIYLMKNKHRLTDAFIEFCERVMLAKWYVQQSPLRFIPHPVIWLNQNYVKGFAGTAEWHQLLQARRSVIVNHHLPLFAMSAYYLNFVLQPTKEHYIECRDVLIELKQPALLQHINNSIIHHHFLTA